MAAKKKRRPSNNPEGRPSHGLSEAQALVRMPAELRDALEAAAEAEGVNIGRWIRQAIRARLGRPEPVDPKEA